MIQARVIGLFPYKQKLMNRRLNVSDFYYLSGIEKRASKMVYRSFGINRHELNMLVGISAYLMLHGKKAVSRKLFTHWLGLNYGLEKRCWAYIGGLVDKGCCYRLAYRRDDGNSLAVSPYGLRILQSYEQEIRQIAQHDRFKGDYNAVVFDPQDAVRGYKIMQHGRL